MDALAAALVAESSIDEDPHPHTPGHSPPWANNMVALMGGPTGHRPLFQGLRGPQCKAVPFYPPRVRSVDGREIPLARYQAFTHPERMQEAISQRILRRVSTRDYAGVLDEVCAGYGIQKSSVSRHGKAASSQQLQQMLERPLGDLDLCVLFLDGREFHDFTLIVALGVDRQGRRHVLGLWSGATENAVVCGALLEDLIARGLPVDKPYLFVLDGAKALKKAVVSRFGSKGLIQRCRVHKKRNIQKYLPKKYHGVLTLKLRMVQISDALSKKLGVGGVPAPGKNVTIPVASLLYALGESNAVRISASAREEARVGQTETITTGEKMKSLLPTPGGALEPRTTETPIGTTLTIRPLALNEGNVVLDVEFASYRLLRSLQVDPASSVPIGPPLVSTQKSANGELSLTPGAPLMVGGWDAPGTPMYTVIRAEILSNGRLPVQE